MSFLLWWDAHAALPLFFLSFWVFSGFQKALRSAQLRKDVSSQKVASVSVALRHRILLAAGTKQDWPWLVLDGSPACSVLVLIALWGLV